MNNSRLATVFVVSDKDSNDVRCTLQFQSSGETGEIVVEEGTLTRIIKNGYIVPENQVLRPKAVKVTVPDDQGTDVEHEIKNCMIIPDSSSRHPEMDIAWELLTLQDGIEFAEYAIKTTIDTMRFQMTPKTVAEPIDILIIKPNGAKWIKHKELHA